MSDDQEDSSQKLDQELANEALAAFDKGDTKSPKEWRMNYSVQLPRPVYDSQACLGVDHELRITPDDQDQ